MKLYRFLIHLVLSSLVIASCHQTDSVVPIRPTEVPTFELFSSFGDFHNAMVAYVDNNIDVNHSSSSLEDGLDYLAEMQSNYADELELGDSNKKYIKGYLNEYKNLYNQENFLLTQSKAEEIQDTEETYTVDEIYASIELAYNCGEIDSFERTAFMNLIDWSSAYLSGEKTAEAFVRDVNLLITDWERRYSDEDFSMLIDREGKVVDEVEEIPHGACSGVVLNISRSSLEYWETLETRALPLIAAQDIVGAVIGGVSGAAGSAVVGGHVNWGSVAWGAAVGAVTGSTGVVGKVAKYLTKLF